MARTRQFTAVYKKSGKWYSAWVEEIPGVNTQGRTLKEAKENLREALSLIIETNRTLALGRNGESGGKGKMSRESIAVAV